MKTKNRIFGFVFIFLLTFLLNVSCSKDDDSTETETEFEITNITLNTAEFELKKGETETLSIANDIGNASLNWSIDDSLIASIGEDGTVTALANGRTTITAQVGSQKATSIVLVTPDVYVAGSESNGHFSVAKYWKNGKEVLLSDGTSDAKTRAIKVKGDKIYVAGYEKVNGQNVAKSWENGQPELLSVDQTLSVAVDVLLSGEDVYYAGYRDRRDTV